MSGRGDVRQEGHDGVDPQVEGRRPAGARKDGLREQAAGLESEHHVRAEESPEPAGGPHHHVRIAQQEARHARTEYGQEEEREEPARPEDALLAVADHVEDVRIEREVHDAGVEECRREEPPELPGLDQLGNEAAHPHEAGDAFEGAEQQLEQEGRGNDARQHVGPDRAPCTEPSGELGEVGWGSAGAYRGGGRTDTTGLEVANEAAPVVGRDGPAG